MNLRQVLKLPNLKPQQLPKRKSTMSNIPFQIPHEQNFCSHRTKESFTRNRPLKRIKTNTLPMRVLYLVTTWNLLRHSKPKTVSGRQHVSTTPLTGEQARSSKENSCRPDTTKILDFAAHLISIIGTSLQIKDFSMTPIGNSINAMSFSLQEQPFMEKTDSKTIEPTTNSFTQDS